MAGNAGRSDVVNKASDSKQKAPGPRRAASDADTEVLRGERRRTDRKQSAASATTATERSRRATQRDETARQSDLTASTRDLVADARDRAAARLAKAVAGDASGDPAIQAFMTSSGGVRSRAAADRAGSANDRQRAAADRRQAQVDRRQAQVDLETAKLDSLTGVYLRDSGRVSLQEAINRSRSSAEPFVLAFIDVDGLKQLNDSAGHAAGDALLQTVGGVLKSKLRRSDPVARVGGDEFLCGLSNTELEVSQVRFEEIRAAVEHAAAAGSITVGLASLGAGETLEDLTARADLDMYSRKPGRRTDD
jgi:diguanylate cyclase (GGDEF)-like protein